MTTGRINQVTTDERPTPKGDGPSARPPRPGERAPASCATSTLGFPLTTLRQGGLTRRRRRYGGSRFPRADVAARRDARHGRPAQVKRSFLSPKDGKRRNLRRFSRHGRVDASRRRSRRLSSTRPTTGPCQPAPREPAAPQASGLVSSVSRCKSDEIRSRPTRCWLHQLRLAPTPHSSQSCSVQQCRITAKHCISTRALKTWRRRGRSSR